MIATMGERGELSTEHGRSAFAVLMAQDLWIVPVMALVGRAQPSAPLMLSGLLGALILRRRRGRRRTS
jgi:Kef-type K+ transport system membrane component KefB